MNSRLTLIQTAGQLLSLGLMIGARDYLEALHLRAKQDPHVLGGSNISKR